MKTLLFPIVKIIFAVIFCVAAFLWIIFAIQEGGYKNRELLWPSVLGLGSLFLYSAYLIYSSWKILANKSISKNLVWISIVGGVSFIAKGVYQDNLILCAIV